MSGYDAVAEAMWLLEHNTPWASASVSQRNRYSALANVAIGVLAQRTPPLPNRLREAVDTIEEVSALYGYPYPEHAVWSAKELRLEAEVMERDTPEGSV